MFKLFPTDYSCHRFNSTRVIDIEKEGNKIKGIYIADGSFVEGDVFIETTGSTGPMGKCLRYGNGCSMCVLRCDYKNKNTTNSRNGHRSKKVISDLGEMEIEVPRDSDGDYRPLELVYPIVFMDAIHYKVRQDNRIVCKAAYAVIGVSMSGVKDVLGIWIGENETSKYWLKVLTELKNREVSDILIAAVDGLNGFSEAIKVVFPRTEIQRCIIHQIRNISRYVS